MSFISDVLNTPEAQASAARAEARWAQMTPAEQRAQQRDGTLGIALQKIVADEERAGVPTEASRERARKADEALGVVEARTRARTRVAERRRRHAARSRVTPLVPLVVIKPHEARSRERRDGTSSRRERASPSDDDGPAAPRSRRRRRP